MEPTQETETNTQPQAQAEISECPVCYKELHVDPHMELQVLKCRICSKDFCLPCIKKWMNEKYEDNPPHMNCPSCRCKFPVFFKGRTELNVISEIKKQYKDIYQKEFEARKVQFQQFAHSKEEDTEEPEWDEEIAEFHKDLRTQSKMILRGRLLPATENSKKSIMLSWIDRLSISSSQIENVIVNEFEKLRTTRIRPVFESIRPQITQILFNQVTAQALIFLSFQQGEITVQDVDDPDIVSVNTISVLKRAYCSRLETLTSVAWWREFYMTEDSRHVTIDQMQCSETDLEIISNIIDNHFDSLGLFDLFKNELRRLISEQQQPGPASADVIEEDPVTEEISTDTPAASMSGNKRRAAPDDDDGA